MGKKLKGFCGTVAQLPLEKRLLRTLCRNIDLYLEIGTYWGGTAIIAALAGAKKVISIDNMDGIRWTEPDPHYPGEMLSVDRILRNFFEFGVEDIIYLVKARSHPLPVSGAYPDVTLIDGDHGPEVINDWHNVKDITKRVILVHDYQDPDLPAITHMVETVAKKDPNWQYVKKIGCTAIFTRREP